jgi:putative DNA primase/helicase
VARLEVIVRLQFDLTEDDANEILSNSRQANNNPDDEIIRQLAAIPPTEYDRKRKEAAKQLGCRVSTLDELVQSRRAETKQAADGIKEATPAAETVDGAALLDEIATVVERYLFLPKTARSALALWIVLTYIIDDVDCLPILAILSPEKRCGKTTLHYVHSEAARAPRPATYSYLAFGSPRRAVRE